MKLTLIYLTYRPGGFDFFGSSLEQQTDQDYELVVVDDFPGRVGRGAVLDYLRDQVRAPLAYYGPSKPRNYLGTRMGLCNAMNTGFIKSSGDYLVFLHDFAALPPDAIECWKKAAMDGGEMTITHGIANMVGGPKPEFPGDIRTWEAATVRLEGKWTWAPEEFELFYLGVSSRFMNEINGVDERGDYCGQFILNSLLYQIRVLGYKINVDRTLSCLMVDHRQWDDNPNEGVDTQWRIRGHHSTLPAEPTWKVPSPNPFKIYELRGK